MRSSLVPGVALIITAALTSMAAQQNPRSQVDTYVASHQKAIVAELVELLSIPNVAADRDNIRKNTTYLTGMLTRRGFRVEVLETDGNPLVWGELQVAGATRTILLYAHYDGQPVAPTGWNQPSAFTPILRSGRMDDGAKEIPGLATLDRFEPDWRIYARAASDDKSPIVALCAALDALKGAGTKLTSNLRVILDGEEEAGSPSMVPAIARYRDKLAADVLFILDGPVHPSERPTVVFGLRGNLLIELTVYGPKFGLHSGHYGNWVPNPAMRLAQLLASMKNDRGEVLIGGFYDGITPMSAEEQAMLAAVPDEPNQLRTLFGIAEEENPALSLQEVLQRPSFNIRGLASEFVGASARTIIPDRAVAAIDIRLVKETPPEAMKEKVRAHLVTQGYHVVEADPDDATRARYPKIVKMTSRPPTNAYRMSPTAPESKIVIEALTRAAGQPPVIIRTSGATAPIAPFIDAMGFPAMSIPIVNFDNNQHGENENVRLGHFFRGIATIAALLTM